MPTAVDQAMTPAAQARPASLSSRPVPVIAGRLPPNRPAGLLALEGGSVYLGRLAGSVRPT